MEIAWIYLDKKAAAIDALKDYSSMEYIIQNHSDDLEEARERMTSLRSSLPDGMPEVKDPKPVKRGWRRRWMSSTFSRSVTAGRWSTWSGSSPRGTL